MSSATPFPWNIAWRKKLWLVVNQGYVPCDNMDEIIASSDNLTIVQKWP